jgi:hypothetical protein
VVEVYRHFRVPCFLRHQGDGDGGSKDLWNVGKFLSDYTALQPRRQPSSIGGCLYFVLFTFLRSVILTNSQTCEEGRLSSVMNSLPMIICENDIAMYPQECELFGIHMMWRKEHLWNLCVFCGVHLPNLVNLFLFL